MRVIITLIFAICAICANGQTTAEIKAFGKGYKYELYRPYPSDEIDSILSPAPKGYKPFYMSHLARHGSRWHSSSKSYTYPLSVLAAADKAGELTELGKRYYADVQIMATDAENRAGELSPIGFEQHRTVAHRMVKNFPEIFHKNSYLDCRSTTVPRCILSMASAVQEITKMVPTATIRMESSDDNKYMKPYKGLNSVKGELETLSDSLQSAYLPDYEPFMARLFTKNQNIDKEKFFYYSYMLGAILGSTAVDGVDNLDYLFTDDELTGLWRASNIRRYALTGPSKPYGATILSGMDPFVENVVYTADRAIEQGNEQATLRFAHDVTVIPFTAILGIKGTNLVSDDWANIGYEWRVNEVTPMGANIQMVFYRSKKSSDILVKILFNEREQILDTTAVTPVKGVYYRWSDIRNYLLSKITK